MKDKKTSEFKFACRACSPEFIQSIKVHANYTLLIACASFDGYEEIKFLVQEMNVDINEQAKNGETALIRAAHFNNLDVVKLLLELGADTELR